MDRLPHLKLLQSDVREIFNCIDGRLYRNKIAKSWKKMAGMPVGVIRKRDGRRVVWINGKTYACARVVWVWHNGEVPPDMQIDHIDGDPLNERIENLRAVPQYINGRNQKVSTRNTSGLVGASLCKRTGKYDCRVKVLGKTHSLGSYEDISVAATVLADFRLKHGFTERHAGTSQWIKDRQAKGEG